MTPAGRYKMSVRVGALIGVAVLATACAANTLYQGIPVAQLNDFQLVEELESAALGLGVEVNRSMYLMAVRPEPAYVLTSSTSTFSGSANATYNAYAMPVGYGTYISGSVSGTSRGVVNTRYEYTDVNAGARLGNMIATAISQARQRNYRERGLEVYEEYERRVLARRAETERLISEFFAVNPDLRSRQTLVAAVAPWAASEGPLDGPATLRRTKEIIDELPRGNGVTGRWHGTFAQTTTTPEGEVFAFSEFVRLDLEQTDTAVTGSGMLGTGEVIEFSGEVVGPDLTAAVANTTSAINVRVTAVAAPTQIAGEFQGFGAGTRIEGTFTLLR